MSLLTELEAAGLKVRPFSNWDTNTNKGRDRRQTVGIVNHWDAIKGTPSPRYYVHDNKYKANIYHIVVRRDGLVDLLSQRYVYHAGRGSLRVLAALRKGRIPSKPRLNIIVGNAYLFSVSVNYHPDEGSMGSLQFETLIKVNQVLLKHFELTSSQIIDHKGWTNRKRDIDTISIPELRVLVDGKGGINMATISVKEFQGILNDAGQKGANGKVLAVDDVMGPNTRFALVNGFKHVGKSIDSVARNLVNTLKARVDKLRNI